MKLTRAHWFIGFLLLAALSTGLWLWDHKAADNSKLVSYFGRPHEALEYVRTSTDLVRAIACCFATAIGSVICAGCIAILLLSIGLWWPKRLGLVEAFAATSQTVPVLVIAAVSVLFERWVFELIGIKPAPDWYCVVPVTLSLVFTPLINGADAINKIPLPVKALLRLWAAPPRWRILHVYLPYILPDVLTGVKASAAWSVGAVLITEGLVSGIPGDTFTLGRPLMSPFRNTEGQTLSVLAIATVLGLFVYVLFLFLQRIIERLLFARVSRTHATYPLQVEA